MTRTRAITLIAALVSVFSTLCAQDVRIDDDGAGAGSYVIGVEDVLNIVTWGEPELSKVVKVRPDGWITLPLVNEIKVAGLTPSEVRVRLNEGMKNYIRDPNVSVMVQEINHFRVFFLGEVKSQGPIQFYGPTRLLQAVSTAGGLTQFSSKRITVLRQENGYEKRIEVDYKKLWAGDPGQENIYLQPGDTLLAK